MLARYAALAALVLIWGTTWAGITVGLEGIPPFTAVALRFAIAAPLLVLAARILGTRLGGGRRLKKLWVINTLFSFAIPYCVVYWAQQWVPSGLEATLFATYPLFVAILAHFFLPAERLRPAALGGVTLGFLGVALIYSEDLAALGGAQVRMAALISLLSPAAAAVSTVQVKRWGAGLPALALSGPPMAFTALTVGALALATERHRPLILDAASVGSLLYLAVLGSAVTFALYFWLLARLPATRLSLITFGTPIVALTVGTLALDEPLTARIMAGVVLVLPGVGLAVVRRDNRGGERSHD